MTDMLQNKLDPARFPNMSVEFAAMVGYLLDRKFTDPVLAELSVTADGHVTGTPAAGDGIGHADAHGDRIGVERQPASIGYGCGPR